MPRIADRAFLPLGFKPTTRDKKKRQTEFLHEASLFDLADQMGKNFAKTLDDLLPDAEDTEDTSFDPDNFSY